MAIPVQNVEKIPCFVLRSLQDAWPVVFLGGLIRKQGWGTLERREGCIKPVETGPPQREDWSIVRALLWARSLVLHGVFFLLSILPHPNRSFVHKPFPSTSPLQGHRPPPWCVNSFTSGSSSFPGLCSELRKENVIAIEEIIRVLDHLFSLSVIMWI